jgi:hypothetical protein
MSVISQNATLAVAFSAKERADDCNSRPLFEQIAVLPRGNVAHSLLTMRLTENVDDNRTAL